ncbi:hypothetical protein [Escherichia coli]|uniref:hypothetical protein n=1 Tax=Escherichia coli TaxID=562 RepID=UPI0005C8E941|nr:hypothetical protein [Escherichia coli]AOT31346.1 hypothetical protein FORC31_0881 [Escherichia coli]EEW5777131.1 hypothetical protein [Escherichia coli]EEZ3569965.1 hypothetical protein [Escherichia coli]EEZ4737565.1 hypothetical protein [Escherichia coli]EEZ5013324.1 hypothetical protein [Escherichia coli]
MKKDNLSKKDETMIFAISATLMLYVDRIYSMASVNKDDAVIYVNDEDVVEFALRIYMKEVLTEFEYYKSAYGTGKEKYEYINITELLKRVMFFHDLYVKDMLIRNIESGRSFDDYSVLDWDVDINR